MPIKRHNLKMFTSNAEKYVIDALCVFKSWSQYHHKHTRFTVIGTETGDFCINMKDQRITGDRNTAGYCDPHVVDMQLVPKRKVLYLIHIGIREELRGQGFGNELYGLVVEFGRRCGCEQVRQTPSGTTKGGATRMGYLLKRGWQTDGIEAFLEL